MKFDIRQTNIAKGVAIMLLLWHHLFYNNPDSYTNYVSVFQLFGVPVEALIADFCKVCVALFLFLSGYGIYISYSKYIKYSKSNGLKCIFADIKYVKNRLLKLLSNYWVVYLIFVPLGLAFGKSFIEVYGNNPFHYIADILGVSFAFYGYYGYTMNATWWFMSLIIVYILLYPLLHKLLLFNSELFLSTVVLLAFTAFHSEFLLFLLPFVFGMYCSKINFFDKVNRLLYRDVYTYLALTILIPAFVILRYIIKNIVRLDFVIALTITLFSFYVLSNIPVVNKVLEELGKKSALIFMFHTFIYYYYFKEFIYSFKYPILIFIVLLAICYAVALLIQLLMKYTHYNDLIKKLTTVKREVYD